MPKKAGAIDCDKFRTISITSQLCKIVLRIVLSRIKNRITSEKRITPPELIGNGFLE